MRVTECDEGDWGLRGLGWRRSPRLWSSCAVRGGEATAARSDSVQMFEIELKVSYMPGRAADARASDLVQVGGGDVVGDSASSDVELHAKWNFPRAHRRREQKLQANLRADELTAIMRGERRVVAGKLTSTMRVPAIRRHDCRAG